MCITLWERTGFDLGSYAKLQAEDDSRPLKSSITVIQLPIMLIWLLRLTKLMRFSLSSAGLKKLL